MAKLTKKQQINLADQLAYLKNTAIIIDDIEIDKIVNEK